MKSTTASDIIEALSKIPKDTKIACVGTFWHGDDNGIRFWSTHDVLVAEIIFNNGGIENE